METRCKLESTAIRARIGWGRRSAWTGDVAGLDSSRGQEPTSRAMVTSFCLCLILSLLLKGHLLAKTSRQTTGWAAVEGYQETSTRQTQPRRQLRVGFALHFLWIECPSFLKSTKDDPTPSRPPRRRRSVPTTARWSLVLFCAGETPVAEKGR